MNILVVTGSPRKGGNTEILADAFAQAAKESGHEVTVRKLSPVWPASTVLPMTASVCRMMI